MGKYINSYSRFVNESAEAEETSPAKPVLDLAAEYMDVATYDVDPNAPLAKVAMDLFDKIKASRGDAAASQFMEKAMPLTSQAIKEGHCADCTEMIEPCEACKAHAAESEDEANLDY